MELLEREAQRAALHQALERARNGKGMTVLVSGEAGVGKTSFVSEFCAPFRPAGSVYWGACDPLFTPRPLGPLYDIALQRMPALLPNLQAGANWLPLALALLKTLLDDPRETVVVFEDVHWADEATCDLLKYLARRIEQTRSLLILTYREDEIGGRNRLRETLGDFPSASTLRVPLSPLTESAVASLARRAAHPVKGIYQATRGNPFFVTEVLRSQGEQIPATVRDAVLTRAAHLPAPARALLDLAALIPGPAPLDLLENIGPLDLTAVDACITAGFSIQSGGVLTFRHELARLAIAGAIAPNHAIHLHQQILTALRRRSENVPLAVLVHHAISARDEKAILEIAPQAAQEASQHGAHREAGRHWQTALDHAQRLPPASRAPLLDGLSFEMYLTGQIDQAIRLREEAIQSWRQGGQAERSGDDLRWLSRLYWFQGSKQPADRYAVEAIQLLEGLPPGQALAMAYSNRSQLYVLEGENNAAITWGNRALQLAREIGDNEISVHALTNIGTAELFRGDAGGVARLTQAMELARSHELHDHVARCYANLSSFAVMHRDYRAAQEYLSQGIAYTAERDMDSYSIYLRGWQARSLFEQGDWTAALSAAQEVLRLSPGSAVIALPAVTVLGELKMRSGDPEAAGWLDQARDLALPTGELQRLGPVAAARAEAAWWSGQSEKALEELSLVYALALQAEDGWQIGELAYWSWRAGAGSALDPAILARIPLCYRAMIQGDWLQAAAEWERIGCPYEQALALSDGDQNARLRALAIFERLGARPAAGSLREQLRRAGVKGLPRGPRLATQANPHGLTGRELQILALLVEGASNAEISNRLSISLKTVDHHVSSVLAKLDVHSRLEAAATARQSGLVFPK